MKQSLILLLISFLFSSCLVIKIYESPPSQLDTSNTPHEVHRKMISSGKSIDLGDMGSHEILFFGDDKAPKKIFFEASSSDRISEDSLSGSGVWNPSTTGKKIQIMTKEGAQPLIILDGTPSENPDAMNEIDTEGIESINVLKGAAAVDKYGVNGANGVIEITLKKD